MEQIFMLECFVKNIVLKLEPRVKEEWEIKLDEEERRKEEELLAAIEAAKKPKKEKKPKKPKKEKKGKKGKEPPMPSEEEMKFKESCSMQINCLPLFDFLMAHDNFVAPEPPPLPGKKKGKNKAKKGKKGKKGGTVALKLPSEPLPQAPYCGVGNAIMFTSRPSKLVEFFHKTPVHVMVWNKSEEFNCVGFCDIDWHSSFFECLQKAEENNPIDFDQGEYRNTTQPQLVYNTVAFRHRIHCEEDLKPSGEVEFVLRLTCFGNKVLTFFVNLPEMENIPGRKYLVDDLKLKDVEVVRHWEGTNIDDIPPIAYLFGAPDIYKKAIKPVEEPQKEFDKYVAPFTSSELAILAMGFPKGPCGGTNCPKRLDYRGSEHQFVPGEFVKGKYQHGMFVNKRDVHGPCGRLDCPLAKKIRQYICNEGSYKTCKKPCPKDYY